MQKIAKDLLSLPDISNEFTGNWLTYLNDGLKVLSQTEQDFTLPSRENDKLYMNLGDSDILEVSHPVPQDNDIIR